MPRYLVPGHPIAGSEQSGVTAAKATLFRRHKVILTPSAETDADALALVDSLWRALGADVEHMEVEHHDEVLAATSHLPHLLAFTLVDSLAKRSENLEIFRYAAGGFRDFTRIAGSDPVMWHDIFSPIARRCCVHWMFFVTTSTRCARPSTLGTGTSCWAFSRAPG